MAGKVKQGKGYLKRLGKAKRKAVLAYLFAAGHLGKTGQKGKYKYRKESRGLRAMRVKAKSPYGSRRRQVAEKYS